MKVITTLSIRIMEEISRDLTKKWSINLLSKIINKHYRPVHAAVQSLITQKFLAKNQNNLVEAVFKNTLLLELAEKQRLTKHNSKEIKIIAEKLSRIKTSFFSAVLFGSSVNKKGNDIDILIIIPDSEKITDFQKQAEEILGSFYSKTDLNIVSEKSCYEMLNTPNQLNVMNEIMKNHLILTGAESFYNILKRWKNG
ncbi:hypothetical protein J4434_02560 [Candidatus Woesearchaeota archaeon]|nr:hypothetical protein [uncultured archaeon]AQS34320.1 hypothetical protein [uncultured archaeon]AQS34334.1 hypothetical protein [uncultured archaeon]MBS3121739.1 hypothetical protein [Candidatus Woesearchaeota archaeon]